MSTTSPLPFISTVIILLATCCVYAQPPVCGPPVTPFIIGGEDAPPGRFPYACSLRSISGNEHICGCVLVDAQHVLTAAHCVDEDFDSSADANPLVVVGLLSRLQNDGTAETFALEGQPVIHPEWNGVLEEGFDIAILKLKKPTKLTPINLPAAERDYSSGAQFVTIGFGDVDPSSKEQLSDRLQILTDLTYINRATCNRSPAYANRITSSMFCAQASTGDTAQGDSGGPALIAHRITSDVAKGDPSLDQLVGLTSFGVEDDPSNHPGVYTRVSAFRIWIDCVMEGGDAEECTRTQGPSLNRRTGAQSSTAQLGGNEVRDAPPDRDEECLLRLGTKTGSLSERQTKCLGVIIPNPFRCVFWERSDEIDCFYRGLDLTAHRLTIKDGNVEGIVSIGGTPLDEVECVITAPRTMSCFIIESDGALWHRELMNGRWNKWQSLGGEWMEAPRCVSRLRGHIDCVGRNLDRSIIHIQYIPGEFNWRDIRETECSSRHFPPVAFVQSDGNIELTFAASDHRIVYQVYNVEDDEWEVCDGFSFPLDLYSQPSVVDYSNATLYHSVSAKSQFAYQLHVKDGRAPYNLKILDHKISSRPECVSTEDFVVDCFALDFEGILGHVRRRSATWSSWTRLTGPFMEAPICIVDSEKLIRCYLRSYTFTLAEVVIEA